MAGEIATKQFSGGMNKDVDYSLLKDNQYIDAQNYRLIADKSPNSFILENAAGNSSWLDISSISGIDDTYVIVGQVYIRPYLVLFFTTNTTDRTPTAGTSKIVRLTIDNDLIQEINVIYDDSAVTGTLGFSATYPIKAVGNYESDDNIKVYFTDGYNDVRWMNIVDSNLANYDTHMLDLVPDFPYNTTTSTNLRPEFDSYITGNITCSVVQYAYQYYVVNGPATVYSAVSAIIPIPAVNSVDSTKVKGGEQDEDSGYGVRMEITTGDSDFEKLRVIAIQYDAYNGTPTCRVFTEIDISSTSETLYINDVGETLTEITYDEFLIQTNTTFTARDLAIKDNRLFAANITETTFDLDVDTRAYRYDTTSGNALAYDADLTNYYTIAGNGDWTATAGLGGGSGSNWSIPATADAINLYNKSNGTSTNDENTNAYKYASNGTTAVGSTTLGAYGPNIEVGIVTSTSELMDIFGTSPTPIGRFQYLDALYDPGDRNWQRNEVYRIGAVIRNKKMQPTPAKWICDFKLPNVYENSTDYSITYVNGGATYRRKLGIYITYHGTVTTWSSLADQGAIAMEMVYVPRESKDRSILAQGIVQSTYYDTADTTFFPIHSMATEASTYSVATVTDEEGIIRLISPEISFNKNLTYESGDFLHYLGDFDYTAGTNDYTGAAVTGHDVYKVFDHTSSASNLTSTRKLVLNDAAVIGYSADETFITTVEQYSYRPYLTEEVTGLSGPNTTHLAIRPYEVIPGTSTPVVTWWAAGAGAANQIPFANYKRDVFTTQYGGVDYQSRQNNTYISCSRPDTSYSGITCSTYEGDTFIDWFYYTNSCNDLEKAAANTEASSFIFPVESSISLSFRLDPGMHRSPYSSIDVMTQEIVGTHVSDCVDGTERTLEQEYALYTYNSVYSQLNKGAFFYPATTDNNDFVETYPTRIKYSNHKINDETLDSFTIFGSNNFYDVDGQYGQLNNIEVFNNTLYFWQDNSFGVASVNTRSLIQDNQPGTLALGTGGILDRIDYISNSVGNQNQFGIAKSEMGMYWVDNNRNEFFKFDGKLKSMSKLGGIQTWVNNQGKIGNAEVVFDPKYNDILFTITFARTLDCTGVSGDYANAFTIAPTANLTTTSYNAKVIGRYTEDTLVPNNNVIAYNSGTGVATLDENPYGTATSFYYATLYNDPTYKYTVSYNELADSFVSFHSFKPSKYINIPGHLLSTQAGGDLYIHSSSSAARSTYYGVEYDSEFTTVFNKEFPYTKVWDTLRWYSESVDSGDDNQFKDTFDVIHMYNDYQHTGPRDLYYKGAAVPGAYPSEIVRRDRTFSMQIPRSIINDDVSNNPDIFNDWDDTQLFKERMRDKYLVVRAIYDNSTGNIFSVPYINAIYRKSRR